MLWLHWRDVIWLLRPAFSRLRTFLWFATAVAGMTVRTELLGVTSIVRALALEPRFYDNLLDLFHSSGVKLDRLSVLWTQAVLRHSRRRRQVVVTVQRIVVETEMSGRQVEDAVQQPADPAAPSRGSETADMYDARGLAWEQGRRRFEPLEMPSLRQFGGEIPRGGESTDPPPDLEQNVTTGNAGWQSTCCNRVLRTCWAALLIGYSGSLSPFSGITAAMHYSEDHRRVIGEPIVDSERKALQQDTSSGSPDLRVRERRFADSGSCSRELIEKFISQSRLLRFMPAGRVVDVALCRGGEP